MTRKKIPASDSESESEHSTDSEVEPQSSSSTESQDTDSELSDSTQYADSEYHTCDEISEDYDQNRGAPDGSL